MPCPPPGYLPDSGIEPTSSAFSGEFFTTEPPGKTCTQWVTGANLLPESFWFKIWLLWWLRRSEICLQCERPGFDPWLARSPGEGHGNLLQYSCLENPHGQRSLVGYGPWGCKESNATEHGRAQLPLEMQADHSIPIHLSILISLLEEARHN